MMDQTVDGVGDPTSRILLHEILSRIFAFLPLADRKSVRLACRLLYDCCTCANITEREKFVFRADSSVEDAAEMMLRSSYSMMNLEFQGLPVSNIPASTWEECGNRIRELELHECRWDDVTVRNITLHCENLTTFVLWEGEFNEWNHLPYPTHLLDDLIKKGIQRPNLLTLSTVIGDGQKSIFHKISLLHPCIKHFSFTVVSKRSLRLYTVSFHVEPFVFTRLDECLDPDMRLESLTCKMRTNGESMETLVNKYDQGVRLKHFETVLQYERSTKDTIFNFFKSQRNLEVIRIDIKVFHEDEIKDFFFHILESCPNLREFRLRTTWGIMTLQHSEVPRFVSSISKLNFLSLGFNVVGSEHSLPWFSMLPADPVQLNLTSLKWDGYICRDPDFYSAFLQRCSSLQHLHLSKCWDSTLQIIFQCLPKLQTLVLDNIDDCTDFGFTGRNVDGNEDDGHSIKRLQQLTYLELLAQLAVDVLATEKSLLKLQLPRLKFLCLNACLLKEVSEEAMNCFASHLPELEVLSIQNLLEDNYLEKIIQFCKRFKNLHRLILRKYVYLDVDSRGKENELIESIFSACHRLRYISWTKDRMYIRDPLTGKVDWRNGCVFKFPKNIFKY